jgi:hypothetical protein
MRLDQGLLPFGTITQLAVKLKKDKALRPSKTARDRAPGNSIAKAAPPDPRTIAFPERMLEAAGEQNPAIALMKYPQIHQIHLGQATEPSKYIVPDNPDSRSVPTITYCVGHCRPTRTNRRHRRRRSPVKQVNHLLSRDKPYRGRAPVGIQSGESVHREILVRHPAAAQRRGIPWCCPDTCIAGPGLAAKTAAHWRTTCPLPLWPAIGLGLSLHPMRSNRNLAR